MHSRCGAVAARLFTAALAAVLGACGTGEGGSSEVVVGPEVVVGSSAARAWVGLDEERRPEALGVQLTDGWLEGAETGTGVHRLPLPSMPGLDFDHVEIEWHPSGHLPAGVFDAAHLDVRFFVVDTVARALMLDTLAAARVPPLEALPGPYVPLPRFRPGTGAYWIDPTAPPFTGEPFTGSVAYGFYDGSMVFLELKLGAAALADRRGSQGQVTAPARPPVADPFRTSWRVDSRRGELRVVLEALR